MRKIWWQIITLIFTLMFLSSCSLFSGSESESSGEDGEAEATFEETGDAVTDSGADTVITEVKENGETAVQEEAQSMGSDNQMAPVEQTTMATQEMVSQDEGDQAVSGSAKIYKVKKDDTLMWVAFKLYGDYRKWREISKWNGGVKDVSEGQKLTYYPPQKLFSWKPGGDPYLILRGDTLGKISNKLYGTIQKWKSLWEHNRAMIKDPNLIFAGFTIYYLK